MRPRSEPGAAGEGVGGFAAHGQPRARHAEGVAGFICEPGFNRLGTVDTMRRYIYIHGSHQLAEMGRPGSIGCIRMRNVDIIELFDTVPAGTTVTITES